MNNSISSIVRSVIPSALRAFFEDEVPEEVKSLFEKTGNFEEVNRPGSLSDPSQSNVTNRTYLILQHARYLSLIKTHLNEVKKDREACDLTAEEEARIETHVILLRACYIDNTVKMRDLQNSHLKADVEEFFQFLKESRKSTDTDDFPDFGRSCELVTVERDDSNSLPSLLNRQDLEACYPYLDRFAELSETNTALPEAQPSLPSLILPLSLTLLGLMLVVELPR